MTSAAARQRRRMIISRFFELLDEHPVDSLFSLSEISERLGVPVRTFGAACHEELGVSPKQYMLLRRMRLARLALPCSKPNPARQ